MADLFDMNVGGVGFHLTSHVIAIAALFIACFAIAGYITFRDDSIKRSALKDGPDNEGVLDRQGDHWIFSKTVTLSTAADAENEVAVPLGIKLPKGTYVKGQLVVLKASVGHADASRLDVVTSTTGGLTAGSAITVVSQGGVSLDPDTVGNQANTTAFTTSTTGNEEYLYLRLEGTGPTLANMTTAGVIHVQLNLYNLESPVLV